MVKESFIQIKKELQKYLSLFTQINIESDIKKVMSPNNLCLTALLKAAERLNCSLFVHPWDMQMDGRMAKYWLPWLVGLCWTGVGNTAPTLEFFQLSLELCSARGRKWDKVESNSNYPWLSFYSDKYNLTGLPDYIFPVNCVS